VSLPLQFPEYLVHRLIVSGQTQETIIDNVLYILIVKVTRYPLRLTSGCTTLQQQLHKKRQTTKATSGMIVSGCTCSRRGLGIMHCWMVGTETSYLRRYAQAVMTTTQRAVRRFRCHAAMNPMASLQSIQPDTDRNNLRQYHRAAER
jgi:hypothetical protein